SVYIQVIACTVGRKTAAGSNGVVRLRFASIVDCKYPPGVLMAENVTDQIVADLRQRANQLYPRCGELRNLRVVGHTPKPDHFIYDLVADFANGSERIAAKVYRPG